MEKVVKDYIIRMQDISRTYNFECGLEEMKKIIAEVLNDKRLENADKIFIYNFTVYPILKERFLITDFEKIRKLFYQD